MTPVCAFLIRSMLELPRSEGKRQDRAMLLFADPVRADCLG